MNHRHLGTIALFGSPMLFIESALNGFGFAQPSRINALLGLLFVIGWACAAIGLRTLRATGRGTVGAFLLAVQLTGLALAASQQVQDFIYTEPPRTLFYVICDVAWPSSVLFMLVVGAFTLAARAFGRWRRWTPLLCGLALPLLFAVSYAAGLRSGIFFFGLYTLTAWALLGVAVRSAPMPSSTRRA